MNTLKNQLKIILWKHWMRRGTQLIKRGDSSAIKLHQAINETINQMIDPTEKAWIIQIEQIRNEFTCNPTPVSILDFGAGNPDNRRTNEEMEQGAMHFTTYGEICMGSKPALWALLLFKLVKIFQPQTVIELGTCIGISAAYQSAAQQLNRKGRLITIEGSEAIAALAKKNIESLRLEQVNVVCGKFKEVLPGILTKTQPIDYVFIDGHHDEQATIAYFEMLLPHLSPDALLVFDDISWSAGMKRAWNKICKNKNVVWAVDLKMIGICLINDEKK